MKKEYMKPTTEVVELKMNHYLMAGSPDTEDVDVSSGEYEEGSMTDL